MSEVETKMRPKQCRVCEAELHPEFGEYGNTCLPCKDDQLVPTSWGYYSNAQKWVTLATCGECNEQVAFCPERLIWIHFEHNPTRTCRDLDLKKPRLADAEVVQGIRGTGRTEEQIVKALMGVQEDEWERKHWTLNSDIDWSWIGRFGRGLAYGWIQVLAELYLPWIGLGCHKIHQLLRRNA